MVSVVRGGSKVENARLLSLIARLQVERPSSRPDVWIGPKNLLSEPETAFLGDLVRSCLPKNDWTLLGWGVVLDRGDVLDWHDHVYGTNEVVAVYYPATGGGVLEFETGEAIEPVASSLILFGSDVRHRVVATESRVSVAINISRG